MILGLVLINVSQLFVALNTMTFLSLSSVFKQLLIPLPTTAATQKKEHTP